jgi:hypothetical protein
MIRAIFTIAREFAHCCERLMFLLKVRHKENFIRSNQTNNRGKQKTACLQNYCRMCNVFGHCAFGDLAD